MLVSAMFRNNGTQTQRTFSRLKYEKRSPFLPHSGGYGTYAAKQIRTERQNWQCWMPNSAHSTEGALEAPVTFRVTGVRCKQN